MTTPGNVTDYEYLFNFILRKHSELNIVACGYDKWNASMLVNQLNANGCNFIEVPQTLTALSEATKDIQKIALKGRLRHGGNPVLRWNNANIVIKKDANENIRINKEESSEKVDGMAALVNAQRVYNEETLNNQDSGISYVDDPFGNFKM
jgi:phage terminase large subunit-like protein